MFDRELVAKSYYVSSVKDLYMHLMMYYNGVREDKVKKYFDMVDKSGDGFLTEEEVKEVLLKIRDSEKKKFDGMPEDEKKKYQDLQLKLHIFYIGDDIDDIIDDIFISKDKNNDSKISFKEFLEDMRSFNLTFFKRNNTLDKLKELQDYLNNFYETVDIASLTAKLTKFSTYSDEIGISVYHLWQEVEKIAREKKADDYDLANYTLFVSLCQGCKYEQFAVNFIPDKKGFFVSPKENIDDLKKILSPTIKEIIDLWNEEKEEE